MLIELAEMMEAELGPLKVESLVEEPADQLGLVLGGMMAQVVGQDWALVWADLWVLVMAQGWVVVWADL